MSQRFCFRIDLYPGAEAEYDRRHQAVWPDVREVIRKSGIRNYSGFRSGTVVFYVGEADDAAAALAQMAADPVTLRWAEFLSDVVAGRPRLPDGSIAAVSEVFFEPGVAVGGQVED